MRPLLCILCASVLAACGGQNGDTDDAAQDTASAGFSAAASAILNTPQESDILIKAQTAMTDISASDIAAAAQAASSAEAVYAGETLFQPAASTAMTASAASLPAACEQYFQRADTCFATQGEDAEALRHLNREARNELALSAAPNEAECRALNDSFNAVAARLGCR